MSPAILGRAAPGHALASKRPREWNMVGRKPGIDVTDKIEHQSTFIRRS